MLSEKQRYFSDVLSTSTFKKHSQFPSNAACKEMLRLPQENTNKELETCAIADKSTILWLP